MPSDKPSIDEMRYATIKATPRNQTLGAIADALTQAREYANRLQVPESVPIIGGIKAGDVLMGRGPEEVNEWSYGNSPFRAPPTSTGGSYLDFVKPGRGQQLADVITAAPVGAALKVAKAAPLVAGTTRAFKAGEQLPLDLAQTVAAENKLKPVGNLNFRPKIDASNFKGPDTQPISNLLQQAKQIPGVTKEGLKTGAETHTLYDPTTKISKQDFVDLLKPSEFSKYDLKNAGANDDVVLWHEAQNRVRFRDVLSELGIPYAHADEVEGLRGYRTDFSQISPELQDIFARKGITPENFHDYMDIAHVDAAARIFDALREDPAARNVGYQYTQYQRLAGPADPDNTAGYFELGVKNPAYSGAYKHYPGADAGTIGHIRGTFLGPYMEDRPTWFDKINKGVIPGLPNPQPNSMLIEEIQSDANKVADQTGPLHQVHGTLFKAAIQHALENGADTVYLPTADAIAYARDTWPSRYASIYDQQVVKEGLNPLKNVPGVTITPPSPSLYTAPWTNSTLDYRIGLKIPPNLVNDFEEFSTNYDTRNPTPASPALDAHFQSLGYKPSADRLQYSDPTTSNSMWWTVYDQRLIDRANFNDAMAEGTTTPYWQIDFSPEAKEQILNGTGQTTPGYKRGGKVDFAHDTDTMRLALLKGR